MSPQQIITITISYRSQRIVAEKVAVEKSKSNNQTWSWRSWLSQRFCHMFWSFPPFLQRGQSQTRKRTKWGSKWYPWQLLNLWLPCLTQYYKTDFFPLKVSVQLFVSVVCFVVVSIKEFQHFNRALWKGCVDVVEIENVSLCLKSHWEMGRHYP